MGCDIHGVIEQRAGDKWVAVNVLGGVTQPYYAGYAYGANAARTRNYARFAALAGVRGAGPEAKGIPPDASETAAFLIAQDGSDGHSHSWLPLADAAVIYATTEPWPDNCEEGKWPRGFPAAAFFGVDSDALDQYRLVFWFDN